MTNTYDLSGISVGQKLAFLTDIDRGKPYYIIGNVTAISDDTVQCGIHQFRKTDGVEIGIYGSRNRQAQPVTKKIIAYNRKLRKKWDNKS